MTSTGTYVKLQAMLWWIFQNGMMFYGVVQPLQYRSLSDSGKLKYLHFSFVATGIGLPLIPVLICNWIGGYGIAVALNYDCLPKNGSGVIYSLFLPLAICAVIGVFMLLLVGSELGIKVLAIDSSV